MTPLTGPLAHSTNYKEMLSHLKKNNYATICEELCTFGTICEYKISQHGNLKVHLAASNIQKESAAKWIIQWICAQQHCKSHFDMRHPVVVRPDQTTSIIITLT